LASLDDGFVPRALRDTVRGTFAAV